MLFRAATLDAIAAGDITTAFRRWTRPTVKRGGTLVTPVGVLAIDTLDVIDPAAITDDDARRAGHASRDALLAMLAAPPGDARRAGLRASERSSSVYRVTFHLAGEDPRIALRQRAQLDVDDLALLTRRLGRLDARPSGAWTERVLRLIGEREGVRAGDLADDVRIERLAFKADVRKLNALGLTESLGSGYRLSPRGQAWLER